MSTIDAFFDSVDQNRILRLKELMETKRILTQPIASDVYDVHSRAAVVLAYAAWEGFFNQCVNSYIDALKTLGISVKDAHWLMLVGSLTAQFESLRSRNHSLAAKSEFIDSLQMKLVSDFEDFDRTIITSKSNLDFEKLRTCLGLMGLSYASFLRNRIRIDKELVGWRHGVAHGDPPSLATMDIEDHIRFTSDLMLNVADTFQEAILNAI